MLIRHAPVDWLTNINEAKKEATAENRFILLNFSGSDWCGPCVRMRKEVFENPDFLSLAGEHLVLVNADFPRSKKHQLSKEQQAINDKTADIYNPTGIFPLTILLRPDGSVVKKWEGFRDTGPDEFIADLKEVLFSEN